MTYLEIQTGFEFICQTTDFYAKLRRPLTEVAYAQYYMFLMIMDPMSPTLLPRYARFLRTPLDPTVPFLDPKLIFFPEALIFSAIPEAKISSMLATMCDYERAEVDQLTTCRIKNGNKLKWLPIIYNPTQAILRLYSSENIHESGGFCQYVRLPFLLTFTDGGTTIRTEHVTTWMGVEWQFYAHGRISMIIWVSHEWILQTFINEDGVVHAIQVRDSNVGILGTFETFDESNSYTIVDRDTLVFEVKYTSMQAFYYPTTPQLSKDTNTTPPDKTSYRWCNIV